MLAQTLGVADLERLAADELIVITPKADPTQERAAYSLSLIHI